MQASIINSRNYIRWRHKGIAYELREGSYDASNRTLVSGMVFKHVRIYTFSTVTLHWWVMHPVFYFYY